MTKKDILKMETIAYYSGFVWGTLPNIYGLEIKGIEHGTDDHVLCVSGAWNGKPKPHRLKVYYTSDTSYIKLNGYKISLDECIRTGV